MVRVTTAIALALILTSSIAMASSYEVRSGEKGNEVVFESKAPMESFEGRTDQVSGRFTINPEHLGDAIQVRIEVELASLDTGIGLRNRHMRDNHLETELYPQAVFTAGRVISTSAPSLTAGQRAKVRLAGQMTLHGVSREVVYDVDVGMHSTNTLTVNGEFTIKLSDYKIKRPKFLVVKLADEQIVRISLVAHQVVIDRRD